MQATGKAARHCEGNYRWRGGKEGRCGAIDKYIHTIHAHLKVSQDVVGRVAGWGGAGRGSVQHACISCDSDHVLNTLLDSVQYFGFIASTT